ncbi:MAG: M66 family metalloprotease [Polyangiaceae bacterium]
MVHEVGHAHGRPHAPCGVSDTDPSFPYSGGTIGVWGYDFRSKALVSPNTGKDFMSYCTPEWVSDYTFGKLFERIRTVNGAPRVVTTTPPADYRFVEVDDAGRTSDSEWTETVRLERAPTSTPRTVSLTGRGGETSAPRRATS